MRRIRYAGLCLVVLAGVLLQSGCESGSIKKATQPNGPPKPHPSAEEAPDSARHSRLAIEQAIAFAKPKYGDRLNFAEVRAIYRGPVSKGPSAPDTKGVMAPALGGWEVWIKRSHIQLEDTPTTLPSSMQEAIPENDIVARVFYVHGDGSVREGQPQRFLMRNITRPAK